MKQHVSSTRKHTAQREHIAPELTTEGIESLLRVATATNDPVMQASWPEMEERIEQNLDLFSDEQLGQLLRIPHWQEVIQQTEPRLSPKMQTRLDALKPRSVIGKLLHVVRRKLRSWSLPEGVTLAETDSVIREYRARLAATKPPMYNDGHIALLNEIIAERFPNLDPAKSRSIRFYFYNRENLIGAS